MGRAKRMRISQRMSRHTMQLKPSFRILFPPSAHQPYWIETY